MESSEPPCECPHHGYCPRYRRDMNEYAHAKCQADPEQRAKWAHRRSLEVRPQSGQVIENLYRDRPGDLMKIKLNKLGLNPAGCRCEERVQQMNSWGVVGCEEHREEIESWLYNEYTRLPLIRYFTAVVQAVKNGYTEPNARLFIRDLLSEVLRLAST